MKFSQITFIASLLVTTVLAAPRSEKSRGLDQRVQRRSANGHLSAPRKASAVSHLANETLNTLYSSNWAGAVYTSPPTGETFNAVSARFIVPTPSIPSDATPESDYAASAWVGIDGDTYSTAILQTGVDFTVSSSGEVSYSAWYEWYPDYAYDFEIDISAGNVISLSVVASTSTSGTATIENQTTGQTVTIDLTSTSALGGQNAEWIVEDFEQNGALVPFASMFPPSLKYLYVLKTGLINF